jgi:hypothetical protein
MTCVKGQNLKNRQNKKRKIPTIGFSLRLKGFSSSPTRLPYSPWMYEQATDLPSNWDSGFPPKRTDKVTIDCVLSWTFVFICRGEHFREILSSLWPIYLPARSAYMPALNPTSAPSGDKCRDDTLFLPALAIFMLRFWGEIFLRI